MQNKTEQARAARRLTACRGAALLHIVSAPFILPSGGGGFTALRGAALLRPALLVDATVAVDVHEGPCRGLGVHDQ